LATQEYEYRTVTLTKKTRCSVCRTQVKDGRPMTVAMKDGKPKANLCSDNCIREHKSPTPTE
jgi:hypothetical protein